MLYPTSVGSDRAFLFVCGAFVQIQVAEFVERSRRAFGLSLAGGIDAARHFDQQAHGFLARQCPASKDYRATYCKPALTAGDSVIQDVASFAGSSAGLAIGSDRRSRRRGRKRIVPQQKQSASSSSPRIAPGA